MAEHVVFGVEVRDKLSENVGVTADIATAGEIDEEEEEEEEDDKRPGDFDFEIAGITCVKTLSGINTLVVLFIISFAVADFDKTFEVLSWCITAIEGLTVDMVVGMVMEFVLRAKGVLLELMRWSVGERHVVMFLSLLLFNVCF